MFIICFVTVALPPLAVIVFVSQVFVLSEKVLPWLATLPQVAGVCDIYHLALAGVAVDALIFYAWTRGKPSKSSVWWVEWWVLFALTVVAAILSLPHHPVFSSAVLVLLGVVLLYPLRRLVFADVPGATWFQAAYASLVLVAAISFVTWLVWLFVGFGMPRTRWTDWRPSFRELVHSEVLTWKCAFVAWILPLAVSFELGIVATLCWIRHRHYLLMTDEHRMDYTVSKVKTLSLWLFAFALLCWIHAGLSVTQPSKFDQARANLKDEVLCLTVWIFGILLAWTVDTLGVDEVTRAAEHSKVVEETKHMAQSDWAKAMLFCVGVVPMGICALLDWARRGSQGRKALLEFASGWAWTSVIVKATWLALLYVSVVVGFTKVTQVFLSMVMEALAGISVFSVSALMFLIGFSIFMLPPAPGPPIYIVMSVVIMSSATRNGWAFETALAWSTFVGFAMKLAFTAAAQKCIGVPLSESKYVRGLCELHTPYMRALEVVLKEPGTFDFGKVMCLIGGPDWPVAVLCGMLDMKVVQVLLGTSPVLVQSVFPCCLAGALMARGHHDVSDLYAAIGAETVLAIAAALQAATGLLAFVTVQEVLERDYEELSVPRPDDVPIIEAQEKEAAINLAFWKQMDWQYLSVHMRFALVFAFLAAEASVTILCLPMSKLVGYACFKKFGLADSVEHDLNGNPLGIVLPLGWVALSLAAVGAACLGWFYSFAGTLVKDAELENGQSETSPLVESR